jgi:hypothetical protein
MQNKFLDSNHLVCAKLSVERCQKYLAHLHALMYMCDPKDLGMDEIMSENARRILSAINNELMLSAKSLAFPDPGEENRAAKFSG